MIFSFQYFDTVGWLTRGQRILTKGHIACRTVVEDWTDSAACCYWWL